MGWELVRKQTKAGDKSQESEEMTALRVTKRWRMAGGAAPGALESRDWWGGRARPAARDPPLPNLAAGATLPPGRVSA